MEKKSTFNADIYIICFFKSKDHEIANPLDLKQWEFFIFTRKQLIELLDERKSISWAMLKKQNIKPIEAYELKQKINSI